MAISRSGYGFVLALIQLEDKTTVAGTFNFPLRFALRNESKVHQQFSKVFQDLGINLINFIDKFSDSQM